MALKEMFPKPLRDVTATTADYASWGVGGLWKLAGKVSWVTITSALVLLAVPLYEADQVSASPLMLCHTPAQSY
jgi:hypothetical protein